MLTKRLNEIWAANNWQFGEDDHEDICFGEFLDDLKEKYTMEEIEHGYSFVSDKRGNGALRVVARPGLGRCSTPEEARKCALMDGYTLIKDLPLPKKHRGTYLDTPENRKILEPIARDYKNTLKTTEEFEK